jgi:hypothetical protein
LAAGEDLATVSNLMGHASVSITANVYLHAFKKPLGESATKLERYLAGNWPKAVTDLLRVAGFLEIATVHADKGHW